MKHLLLITTIAFFYADYRRFKAESLIRSAAGESKHERTRRL